jgi:hypothetical protein
MSAASAGLTGQRPKVGLEGLTPHELRHTAASLAISAGANVKAVQRILGHASAAVTLDVYADLFDEDLDTVGASLDRIAMQTSIADLVTDMRRPTWEDRPTLAAPQAGTNGPSL